MNEQVRRYLISRFAAGTALTLLRVTVSWHVYRLTGSELLLGMIGLAQFIPAVAFLLGGGVLEFLAEELPLFAKARIRIGNVARVGIKAHVADGDWQVVNDETRSAADVYNAVPRLKRRVLSQGLQSPLVKTAPVLVRLVDDGVLQNVSERHADRPFP